MSPYPAWWSRVGPLALAIGALWVLARADHSVARVGRPREAVLLLTGGTGGYLEPCGCGRERRGGLAGRAALLRALRAADPGALLVDVGDNVSSACRQGELKFQATSLALGRMGYDAVGLGEKDLALDASIVSICQAAPFVCSNLTSQWSRTRRHLTCTSAGTRVAVVAVTEADAHKGTSDPVAALLSLAPAIRGSADVLVLLAHTPSTAAMDLPRQLAMPCVVVTHPSQGEPLPPRAGPNFVAVDPGSSGRWLTHLDVRLSPAGKLASYAHKVIPITAPQKPDPADLAPLRFYRARLAAEDMVERTPQVPLASNEHYVGDEDCTRCHADQETAWGRSQHARAYSTLLHSGADVDPECVVCHTVGFGFQTGFAGVKGTRHLTDVRCESCHGPAGRHIESPATKPPADARASCVTCHTPEHSPHYDAAKYLARIRHW